MHPENANNDHPAGANFSKCLRVFEVCKFAIAPDFSKNGFGRIASPEMAGRITESRSHCSGSSLGSRNRWACRRALISASLISRPGLSSPSTQLVLNALRLVGVRLPACTGPCYPGPAALISRPSSADKHSPPGFTDRCTVPRNSYICVSPKPRPCYFLEKTNSRGTRGRRPH